MGDEIKENQMHTCEREQVHTRFWWEKLKETDYFQDLRKDGRIILNTSLKK
jgi:hypothetical protein